MPSRAGGDVDSDENETMVPPTESFANLVLSDKPNSGSIRNSLRTDTVIEHRINAPTDQDPSSSRTPGSRTFSDFPDEILSLILEMSEVDPMELRTLSRRMLEIVTLNPHLWTTILPDMPLSRIRLSLLHSREQTLDVQLFLRADIRSQTLLSLFQVQHWARVGRLSVACDRTFSLELSKAFTDLRMLRLRYFKLQFDVAAWRPSTTSPDCTFYGALYAPMLRSLHANNEVPLPIPGMELEELSITPGIRMALIPTLPRVFNTLAASQNLKSLTLNLNLRVETFQPDITPVELPHVTFVDFTFHVKCYYLELSPWKTIVDNIVLPSVEEMRLQAELYHNSGLNFAELASLFTVGSIPRYPKLRTLTLHTENCDEFDLILPAIFHSLPNLQHFVLNIRGYGFLMPTSEDLYIWEQGGQSFPRLKSICFDGWKHKRGPEFFDFFLQWLLDRKTIAYPLTDNNDPHERMTLKAVHCAEHVKPWIDAWRTRYDVEWYDEETQ